MMNGIGQVIRFAIVVLTLLLCTDSVLDSPSAEEVRALRRSLTTPPPGSSVSTDPNYQFMKQLGPPSSPLYIYFSSNSTHGKVKFTFAQTGYISFGPSTAMVNGTVIIGVDASVNAGMESVALYKLLAKTGTVQQIQQVVATQAQLCAYGILSPSYTTSGGASSLAFTILKGAQQSSFTLFQSSGASMIFAAGPAQYSQHTWSGTIGNMVLDTSNSVASPTSACTTTAPTTKAPSVSTPAPTKPPTFSGATWIPTYSPTTHTLTPTLTPTAGFKSTDSNYDTEANLAPGMIIYYKTNATHGMFRVQYTTSGYVSFGVGSAMIGNLALVGMDPTQNSGYPSVGLYLLNSKVGNPSNVMSNVAVTPVALAAYGIFETSFSTSASSSDLKWTIQASKQQATFTLLAGPNFTTPLDTMYAAGPPAYSLHDVYGTLLQISFATGSSSSGGLPNTVNTFAMDSKLAAHIALMIVAWQMVSPFGVIVALFNNSNHGNRAACRLCGQIWFKMHWMALTCGVFASFLGFVIVVAYEEDQGTPHFSTTHRRFGLVVFLTSLVQPVMGYLRPSKPKDGELMSRRRVAFEVMHPLVGYLLVLLAAITCLLGVDELAQVTGGNDYLFAAMRGTVGYSGTLGLVIVLLTVTIFLFILAGMLRRWYDRRNMTNTRPNKQVDDTEALAVQAVLSAPILWRDVKAHNTQASCWIVYNSNVYDVTTFIAVHPGGAQALLRSAGQDITTAFDRIGHSETARTVMSRYLLGQILNQDEHQLTVAVIDSAPPKPSHLMRKM